MPDLIEDVVIVLQGYQRDEPFDEIVLEFYEKSKAGNSGNVPPKLTPQVLTHELDLLQVHEVTLGFVGPALRPGGVFRDGSQIVCGSLTVCGGRSFAVAQAAQDPMHDQVRVATDGGSKVSVVLEM